MEVRNRPLTKPLKTCGNVQANRGFVRPSKPDIYVIGFSFPVVSQGQARIRIRCRRQPIHYGRSLLTFPFLPFF